MSDLVERDFWGDRLLGQAGTPRHAITILTLLAASAWGIYQTTENAPRQRDKPERQPGTVLTDIAVPEPLCQRAKEGDAPFLSDFETYQRFLKKQGLERGVCIIRVYSIEGVFLYHAFPSLDDLATFQMIVHLPEWMSEPAEGTLPRPAVHPLPTEQLSRRAAAEAALASRIFPSTPAWLANPRD